jgi:lipopolysaccharide transport system permease protein
MLPDKPVVVNDASERVSARAFFDLWIYRELLYFLTWRDIKVRYKQATMGVAWAVIQPLFMMLTFALFFGLLVGAPTDGMPYLVFYYCGLLPWTFFSNSVSNSNMSLVANSHLITKVYFPRVLVPAATIGAGLLDLLISSFILLGLALFYGLGMTWSILLLPCLILLTVMLSLGLGMWLAILTVKYRDIRHALPFVLQLWMFLTPIIYPLSVVPEKWRWLLSLNPLTGIVEGIRASLFGRPFDRLAILLSIVVTLGVAIFSFFAFRRIEKSLADLI